LLLAGTGTRRIAVPAAGTPDVFQFTMTSD